LEADPLSIDEKVRDGACPEQNGAFLSSNFELYADVSNRVMRTIQGMVPDVEAYSIDEC
jgi:nucleotidyltransferase/DNA polymerase involved in DNA repair